VRIGGDFPALIIGTAHLDRHGRIGMPRCTVTVCVHIDALKMKLLLPLHPVATLSFT